MTSKRRPRRIITYEEVPEEVMAKYRREKNEEIIRQLVDRRKRANQLNREHIKKKQPTQQERANNALHQIQRMRRFNEPPKKDDKKEDDKPLHEPPKKVEKKEADKPKSKRERYDELVKKIKELDPNDADYQRKRREWDMQMNKLIDEMDEERNPKPKPKDDEREPYYRYYRYAGGHQQDFADAEKRYRDWRRKEIEYYRDKNKDEWRKQHGYPKKRRWQR